MTNQSELESLVALEAALRSLGCSDCGDTAAIPLGLPYTPIAHEVAAAHDPPMVALLTINAS